MKPTISVLLILLSVLAVRADGEAEVEPVVFLNGTLDLASAFSEDGAPQVNQLRRGDSPFDNIRATLFGDVAFGPRLTLFNQVLIDPTSRASIKSFFRSYFRFSAFSGEQADLSFVAGKIPTTFGSYAPRAYSSRNALIGMPLMYHYFSSLRSNQLPADNADLLAHRGEGPSSAFGQFKGGGVARAFSGLPIIYDVCWDTGIQAIGSLWRLEYLVAMTQGTLSDPRSGGGDNNDGKQVVAHVGFVPLTGLLLGASYARGPYLAAAVGRALPQGAGVEDFHQEAVGFDLEFGIRHLKLIGEFVANRWESPNITDRQGNRADLKNVGWYIEGRYAFGPGFYAAVRYDRLRFEKIDDGSGNEVAWDDSVERWEGGIGYHFMDGVIGKVMVQDTQKDRVPRVTFLATQLSLSF